MAPLSQAMLRPFVGSTHGSTHGFSCPRVCDGRVTTIHDLSGLFSVHKDIRWPIFGDVGDILDEKAMSFFRVVPTFLAHSGVSGLLRVHQHQVEDIMLFVIRVA